MTRPLVMLDGQQIAGTLDDWGNGTSDIKDMLVVSDIDIEWGQDTPLTMPQPTTCKLRLMDSGDGSVAASLKQRSLTIIYPKNGTNFQVFVGRITSVAMTKGVFVSYWDTSARGELPCWYYDIVAADPTAELDGLQPVGPAPTWQPGQNLRWATGGSNANGLTLAQKLAWLQTNNRPDGTKWWPANLNTTLPPLPAATVGGVMYNAGDSVSALQVIADEASYGSHLFPVVAEGTSGVGMGMNFLGMPLQVSAGTVSVWSEGFEHAGAFPPGAENTDGKSAIFTASNPSEAPRTGSYGLRLGVFNQYKGARVILKPTGTLKANHVYELEFYTRDFTSPLANPARVASVVAYDGAANTMGSTQVSYSGAASTSWTRRTFRFTPSSSTSWSLYITNTGGAGMLMDDYALTDLSVRDATLANLKDVSIDDYLDEFAVDRPQRMDVDGIVKTGIIRYKRMRRAIAAPEDGMGDVGLMSMESTDPIDETVPGGDSAQVAEFNAPAWPTASTYAGIERIPVGLARTIGKSGWPELTIRDVEQSVATGFLHGYGYNRTTPSVVWFLRPWPGETIGAQDGGTGMYWRAPWRMRISEFFKTFQVCWPTWLANVVEIRAGRVKFVAATQKWQITWKGMPAWQETQ